jgi:hypothetical protein
MKLAMGRERYPFVGAPISIRYVVVIWSLKTHLPYYVELGTKYQQV